MTVEIDGMIDNAAAVRLSPLVPLDDAGRGALRLASERSRRIMPRREVQVEGSAIREPLLVLRGWAARIRVLSDGRRQITNFTLPGDLVGLYRHDRPVASSTIVALTPVTVCAAPDAAVSATLAQAYAVSAAHDEAYLLAQIARLGRLNAHERIADLLLELMERLELAGLATQGRFGLPLTPGDAGGRAGADGGACEPHAAAGAACGRAELAGEGNGDPRSGRAGPTGRAGAGAGQWLNRSLPAIRRIR